VETDPDQRQEGADALAAIGRWGATEYLTELARNAPQPVASLRAMLALYNGGDRAELAKLSEPLGPVLKLLTGHLGKARDADARILSLLGHLGLHLVHVPAGEFLMSERVGAMMNVGYGLNSRNTGSASIP
jgi:hypothetical protein